MSDAEDDEPISAGQSTSEASTSFPAATITKLVKDNLPEGTRRCRRHTAASACLSEFLEMVTTQANAKATEKRKSEDSMVSINQPHVLAALDELGFGHYAEGGSSSSSSSSGAMPPPLPLPDGGDSFDGSAAAAPTPAPAAAAAAGRKKGKKKRGPPDSGLSEEELLRMQQELFASAKQNMDAAQGHAQG